MWLVNTQTITLEQHTDPTPPYAILSHTWTSNEVTFQDLRLADAERDAFRQSPGYIKVLQTCRLAREEGYEYAWVDTCCIDKTSSAELSEAINSMFSWYKCSAVCYAHLEDFDGDLPDGDEDFVRRSDFARCRWFTRGWTLQELIAPRRLVFYDARWRPIADKHSISGTLRIVTGIDDDILSRKANLFAVTVRTRMAWAAGRRTTRIEDAAYCLLGIFNVNMPLIYGEGYKAFQRLQEEIAMKMSGDMTLFAWLPGPRLPPPHHRPPEYMDLRQGVDQGPSYRGAFAWSPDEFLLEAGSGYVPDDEEGELVVASPGSLELDARAGVVLRNLSVRWEGLLSPPRFFLEIPLGQGRMLCRAIEKTPRGYAFKSGAAVTPRRLKGWKYAASEVRLVSQADAAVLEAQRPAPRVYLRIDLKVALVAPTLVWPAERWDRVPQWFMYTLPELTSMTRPTILGVALVRPVVNVEASPGIFETRQLDIICAICVIPRQPGDDDDGQGETGLPRLLSMVLVKQSSNRFARIVHSFVEGESRDNLHDAVLYMQLNLRSSPDQWLDWARGFGQRGQELDLQAAEGDGAIPGVRVRTFSADRPVDYVEGNYWWNLEVWHDVRSREADWVPTSWVTPFNQWDPQEGRYKRMFSRQAIVPLGDEVTVPAVTVSRPSWQPGVSETGAERRSARTLVERTSRISLLDKLRS